MCAQEKRGDNKDYILPTYKTQNNNKNEDLIIKQLQTFIYTAAGAADCGCDGVKNLTRQCVLFKRCTQQQREKCGISTKEREK